MEKEKDFIYVDETGAYFAANDFKVGFAKARAIIKWLKETNLPLYWDVLWDCLERGNLLNAYRERYAKENFLNINDAAIRNELFDKFVALQDAYNRYPFPQQYVKRNEDGSFEDIDHDKIDQDFLEKHTYRFPAEVHALIESMRQGREAGYNLKVIAENLYLDGDKASVNYAGIGKIFGFGK